MDLATIIGFVAALAITMTANVLAGGNPMQLVSSPVPIMLCLIAPFLISTMQYPLKITLGLSTTVACGPDSLDQKFLTSLTRVGSYVLTGQDINLQYADGNGMMVLRMQ